MRAPSALTRVVAARFISRAGGEAAFFVGVWGKAAFELKATPGQLAAVMFAMAVASILGSTLAGVLIDRHGPRTVLVRAEILFVPATVAVAFAGDLVVLVAIVAVWAFVGSLVMTAGASFAPFLVSGHKELQHANARIEGAGSASFVVGPALGAIIVSVASVGWVFAFDAVTSLVAAALVWPVHAAGRAPGGEERHPLAEMREGLRVAYGARPVRYYLLAGTVVWLSFGAFGALEPLFFRDVVGTGVEALGWINTFFGLAMLFGAWLLLRLPSRVLSATGLAATVALSGLGTVAYVGSGDIRLVALGALAWGTVLGVIEPLLRTLVQRDTPKELVGRVMGTAQVHHHGGELIPLAFAPALAARFGVQATLIGGGLVATVIALLSLVEARAVDREVAAAGVGPAEPERFKTADEPVSPNP